MISSRNTSENMICPMWLVRNSSKIISGTYSFEIRFIPMRFVLIFKYKRYSFCVDAYNMAKSSWCYFVLLTIQTSELLPTSGIFDNLQAEKVNVKIFCCFQINFLEQCPAPAKVGANTRLAGSPEDLKSQKKYEITLGVKIDSCTRPLLFILRPFSFLSYPRYSSSPCFILLLKNGQLGRNIS